jgi:glutamine amidotransferase-like uncharacterized protein
MRPMTKPSPTGTARPTALVYHDAGTGEFCRGSLIQALSSTLGEQFEVRRILAEEIIASDDWHRGTCLLAIPGGADRPYAALLDGSGNASIRRFVASGGAFLGVCAGAYYASRRISFEATPRGVITGERELALFEGTAAGSLHDIAEPYSTSHLRCAAVATVRGTATGREHSVLYWGGPEFLPDPGTSYTPLLHYVRDVPDVRDPSPARDPNHFAIAALATRFGAGRAVLTGVHAEITGSQFPIEVSRFPERDFAHGMALARTLGQNDRERAEVFSLLLAACGLTAATGRATT